MKQILMLIIIFSSLNLTALTVQITGKHEELLLTSNLNYVLPLSVQDITVMAFEQYHIPYQGDQSGISQIFNLGSDLKVVSNDELKAYGWCFSIDGAIVETMPDQTKVLHKDSIIHWFYAYAHYKNGEWINQCVPYSN